MQPYGCVFGRQQRVSYPNKPRPEADEDPADVLSAGPERGKEGVAGGALQGAACEASVGFYMADFVFDGSAAAKVGDQLRRQAAAGASDQDTVSRFALAKLAAGDNGQIGALVAQDFHLFQRLTRTRPLPKSGA